MTTEVVIAWIRALLLLALVIFFGTSLCIGLMHDDAGGQFGRLRQGTGQDPGVRVLLSNRTSTAKDNAGQVLKTFETVDLTILQAVDVVTPDDTGNPERRLTLAAGAKLQVFPDANDGLVLSSKEWGKEYRWNVTHVHVQPQNTSASAPDGMPPGRRDPTGFEAGDNDAVFALQGRRYRGSVEIAWTTPKEVMAIGCLPIESYVDGVIAVEMSPSYPLEALKAQAIASRSYAYARAWAARAAHQPFDVMDGIDDQDYRGHGNGTGLVNRAVFDTRGIITFTDLANRLAPFAPLFSASSGGYCAGIESLIADARDAYGASLAHTIMPTQPDPFCRPAAEGLGYISTHWQTSDVLKPAEIRAAIAKLAKQYNDPRLAQVGYIRNLRVGRRNPQSNRVETVIIEHTVGEPIELPGYLFRLMMGPSHIRSMLWTSDSPKRVDSADGRTKDYVISCLGYGHGVGMSQISAYEMARQGWMAKDILSFFYPGVVLRPVW